MSAPNETGAPLRVALGSQSGGMTPDVVRHLRLERRAKQQQGMCSRRVLPTRPVRVRFQRGQVGQIAAW